MRGAIAGLCVLLLIGCSPLTAEKILENPGDYEDRQVTLTATPELGPVRCTRMACSPENPCCNICGATPVIKTAQGEIAIEGVVCRGNECTLDCAPLEAYKESEITGTFRRTEAGYVIELETP